MVLLERWSKYRQYHLELETAGLNREVVLILSGLKGRFLLFQVYRNYANLFFNCR